MDKHPASSTEKSSEPPAPEVLRAQTDEKTPLEQAAAASGKPKLNSRSRHVTYRPSHKATFIGLGVVVLILAINAGIIIFLMQNQEKIGRAHV